MPDNHLQETMLLITPRILHQKVEQTTINTHRVTKFNGFTSPIGTHVGIY